MISNHLETKIRNFKHPKYDNDHGPYKFRAFRAKNRPYGDIFGNLLFSETRKLKCPGSSLWHLGVKSVISDEFRITRIIVLGVRAEKISKKLDFLAIIRLPVTICRNHRKILYHRVFSTLKTVKNHAKNFRKTPVSHGNNLQFVTLMVNLNPGHGR